MRRWSICKASSTPLRKTSPPELIATLLLLLSGSGVAADDFQSCLAGLQERARERGIDAQIVDQVIPGLKQQPRVLELDRQQPEFIKTFAEYINARVTDKRVARGRELYARHREFLKGLTRQYGIPGHYLVAFWGLETNFGSFLGSTPTLDALATLACDQRRSEFFTGELLTALELVQRDNLEPGGMKGSWAGAMGHTQFMPSTYEKAAVDGNGDGRIDLWGTPEDALASGANFLAQLGWQRGLRWGREVILPENFDWQQVGLDTQTTIRRWAEAGLRRADGHPLPAADVDASIIVPAGHRGPAFMVYDNFRVIMGWNRSEFYALSVGHLADRIAGGGRLIQPPPEAQQALSRDAVREIQTLLSALGFDAGKTDGILGPGTRRAISRFQQQQGRVADGYPDPDTVEALRARGRKAGE